MTKTQDKPSQNIYSIIRNYKVKVNHDSRINGPQSPLDLLPHLPRFIDKMTEDYQKYFGPMIRRSNEYYCPEIFRTNYIFKSKSDLKSFLRCNLAAAIISTERLAESMKKHVTEGKSDWAEGCAHNISLIGYDICTILKNCEHHLQKNESYSNSFRRNRAYSYEMHAAAEQLFYGVLNKDLLGAEMTIIPTSIFLIRLTLENKIRGIIGLDLIADENGFPIKTDYFNESLFVIKKYKSEIIVPIDLSVIKKIYSWSNIFIHFGRSDFVWQIEWALHIMKAFHNRPEHNGNWSIYGDVKLPSEVLQKIRKEIEETLHQKKQKPIWGEVQAFIMSSKTLPQTED